MADGRVLAQSVPSPWKASDIGDPVLQGGAAGAGGTFVVTAAGEDIWDRSDEFRFVYRAITGDVEVTAKVESVANADPWSKAGVMIRSSLKADAAHASAFVSAGKGLAFQSRSANGGLSAHVPGGASRAPYWVRVVRTGTKVTAYFSANGSKWTAAGTVDVALGSVAYVGLAVTSHNPTTFTGATLSAVKVRSLAAGAEPLPDGMTSADIGAPSARGHAAHSGGTLRVSGAGADIWGGRDQFHYVYRRVTGDVDIRVRLASIENVHSWSKAGVMIRETLSDDSRHAMALISAGKGVAFQRRPDTGGLTDHTLGATGTAPGWIRLVRSGTTIEAFRSANGETWKSMGSDVIPMDETVYVGLAVTSHLAGHVADAVFDGLSVSVAATGPNAAPSITLTAPRGGLTFAAGQNITLTASAADADGKVARVEFMVDNWRVGADTSAPYSTIWASAPAGTYTLSAYAYDDEGASTQSNKVTIAVKGTVDSPDVPGGGWAVIFDASTTHSIVTRYVLEVFSAGATPGSATPIATVNLGRPKPDSNNEITVDGTAVLGSLKAGSYIATVRAENSVGSNRSEAVPFTR
jgi:regulation of enolase protein 1 (concanavalin A-like superfamily)